MSSVLGPSVSYVDTLDIKTLEASRAEEQQLATGKKPEYNPLRPSSSGRCTRELAYALMEYLQKEYYKKEPREPNVTRLLSLGHFLEPHMTKQFRMFMSDYVKIRYEQQSVYGFDVKSAEIDELNHLVEGSLDWCFISKDHKGIIDLKTKKDKFHQFYKTDWDSTEDKLQRMSTTIALNGSEQAYWVEDLEAFLVELNDPFFEANFWQLNFYSNTDWAKKIGIDHAAIIQYNKNDSRIREVRFKPSAGLYKRTAEKFQNAVNAASRGEPQGAPRDFVLGSIKCAFCAYNEPCWNKRRKQVQKAFFNTLPNKTWPKSTDRLKVALSKGLEEAYGEYTDAKTQTDKMQLAEKKILKLLEDNNINKVEFNDGHVYESKLLKSPRPHLALRRTKK